MLWKQMKSVYLHCCVLPKIRRTYRQLSVKEAFRNIYKTKAWGNDGTPFFSGGGSRGQAMEQYCAFVIDFIRDHRVRSIVDLGCGDFAVGKRIVESSGILYTGVDVVPELIEHHKQTIKHPNVNFQCADITWEPVPKADLCLIRQVFQHLSNHEIEKVLSNLPRLSWILISEDVPVRPKLFNRDKLHGPDVRSYYGSGVYVELPPFCRKVVRRWEIPLAYDSVLRTVLLDQAA